MLMFFNVVTGLGPGGLLIDKMARKVSSECLSGSSHGGKGDQGNKLKAGQPYDKENVTSLLGGSGGECVYIIIFYNPVRIFPLLSLITGKTPFQTSSDLSVNKN